MRFLPLSLALPAVLCTVLLVGQEKAQPRPVNYDAESYLVQRVDSVTTMNADGTGTRERTMAVKVQSDAALRSFGVVSVAFAGASEKAEFTYVRVRRPDGTVAETPVADAQEQAAPVTREAPFYSDLKEKQLPVKNLRVGDTLEWQFRVTRTKAEAPGEFWGQDAFLNEGVSLSENFELRYPAAVTVTLWTNPSLGAKPVETTTDGQHIVRWTHSRLNPTVGPAADAEKKLKEKTPLTADEEKDATEGSLPSVAWTTFKSWQAVGAWYRSLEGTRMAPDDAVKARVAELTAGKTTEQEKVQAVYAYVSANIRYIGVAFGIGRYQPHHADEVLDNQYGDCKDKHTLLAAMLTALGLHPDAVLIGEGVRFNPDVPSPSAFNHLITRVQVAGQTVWLDSTAEVAPYKMLSLAIRDKQALVVPETGAATLERSPADPPFASFAEMKAVGELDKNGHSESKMEMTMRGDVELFLRQFIHQIAPAQYEDFVKRFMSGLGYGGTVSHVEVGRPEATADPLSFHFDYSRDKAGNWDQLQTLPQLLIVALPIIDEKEPPIQSIDLGWPRTEHSSSEMKLPEGWHVELPEAVHAKAPFATYDITFRFEKGILYADRKLVILKERIPAADWKSYKAWQDKVSPGSEPYVQLIRGGSANTGNSNAQASTAKGTQAQSVEAAELIRKAYVAMQDKDVTAASALLDKAKALNDKQRGLWSALAALQWLLGAPSQGIADYHYELELYPDTYGVYEQIAGLLVGAGKENEAKENLRQWAAADPTNPEPMRRLMAMLTADGKPKEALSIGQAALRNLPEDKRNGESFQLALGEAQAKAGLPAQAHATWLKVLNSTDDTLWMNDSAYALANAGFELPLAEKKEREVLDRLTAESKTWTLDESPQTLLQKSSLLVASWDTTGWILFREGKLLESISYLNAAWHTTRRSEVGQHLGDAMLAFHDNDGALRAFELAKAAVPTTYNNGKREPRPEDKQFDERIEAAKKAGAKSAFSDEDDARLSYRGMNAIPPIPADGMTGTSDFRILVSREGVERAIPAGPETLAGAAEKLEKLKLPEYFPRDETARLVMLVSVTCEHESCRLRIR